MWIVKRAILRIASPFFLLFLAAACGSVVVDSPSETDVTSPDPEPEPESCPPGAQEPCYSGPDGTLDIGVCHAGVRVCPSSGGAWTECVGEVVPSTEVCSTFADESCDGVTACEEQGLWARDMESAEGSARANDVAVDRWGNVLVTGQFEHHVDLAGLSLDGEPGGAFVFKLNSSGEGLWAWQASGAEYGLAIGADADGNVLVAGSFSGTAEIGGEELVSDGPVDLFFAKLDPEGKLLWARKLGGPGYQWPEAMAVDAGGNMLVIGGLHDGADLGDGYLPSFGETDFFVVKYGPDGVRQWSRQFGAAGYDHGLGIAALDDGSMVITGSFDGTLALGGAPLVTAGSVDVFLARLSTNGDHVWSRRFGGGGADLGKGVAVGPTGIVVVAGLISGSVDLGTGPVSAGGSYDLFTAWYGSDGEALGARVGGGPGATVEALDVAVDGAQQAVVTGLMTGTATFDGTPLVSSDTSPGATTDVLVARYAPVGDLVHARVFGDAEKQSVTGVAVDAAGNVILAGSFSGTIDFGTGPLSAPPSPASDLFVAKLSP